MFHFAKTAASFLGVGALGYGLGRVQENEKAQERIRDYKTELLESNLQVIELQRRLHERTPKVQQVPQNLGDKVNTGVLFTKQEIAAARECLILGKESALGVGQEPLRKHIEASEVVHDYQAQY